MPTTTAPPRVQRVEPSTAQRTAALRQLHGALQESLAAADSRSDLLSRFVEVLARYAGPRVVYFFEFPSNDRPALASCLLTHDDAGDHLRLSQQLEAQCRIACGRGEFELRRQAAPPRIQLAIPVPRFDCDRAAFGLLLADETPNDDQLLIVQTLVFHFAQWLAFDAGRRARSEARDAAAIVELAENIAAAPTLRSACFELAADVQGYLDCRRVVIALRPRGKGRCRVAAISGVARFDKRSTSLQSMEAALDEAVVRGEMTVWPQSTDGHHGEALTHKQLCAQEEAAAVVSMPLRRDDENAIASMMVLCESPDSLPVAERFLRTAAPILAHSLQAARRLEGGLAAKSGRFVQRTCRSIRGRLALAAVFVLLACLAIPAPYKVSCQCQLEPVTRRFVAAPFAGTLERSLVKPGDIVQEGQTLAQMDGREIRWRRAGLAADRDRAKKKRVAAQASHDYSEQQIAALEMERLDMQLRLLDHHAENLSIKSPVAGIVTTGDLRRTEGAPLQTGQSLFEIAPLGKMIVEVAVSDESVSHVAAGQTVEIRLDAFPGEVWRAEVINIHPRAEIRDNRNVFIAEAVIDNSDARIRPGSQGRAKIITAKKSLGWILFHRPWEYLRRL